MGKQDPREIADALAALAAGHDPSAEEAGHVAPAPPPSRSSRPALPSDVLPPIAQTAADPDDAVLAPPADPAVLGRVASPHPGQRFSLEARRTMIPVLLTCGVLLAVTGALKYVVGPDSPFAPLPIGFVVSSFALGAALLAIAIMMMFGVRAELAARGANIYRR